MAPAAAGVIDFFRRWLVPAPAKTFQERK